MKKTILQADFWLVKYVMFYAWLQVCYLLYKMEFLG